MNELKITGQSRLFCLIDLPCEPLLLLLSEYYHFYSVQRNWFFGKKTTNTSTASAFFVFAEDALDD